MIESRRSNSARCIADDGTGATGRRQYRMVAHPGAQSEGTSSSTRPIREAAQANPDLSITSIDLMMTGGNANGISRLRGMWEMSVEITTSSFRRLIPDD